MIAARKLDLDLADDPVWAAACSAPPCTEPVPAEELAAFEEAIDEYHAGRAPMVGHGEMLAGLEAMRRDARG